MTLHSYNILSETPDHLRGVYDIVHVRNFSFVVRDSEAERVIGDVLQLLSMYPLSIVWAHPKPYIAC